MVIKEMLTPDIAITWLPWAVQYFFMIALAFGAVWIATTEIIVNEANNKRLLMLAALLMISSAIVAPVALLSDLHQPARALNFYTQLRLSSWMWFGAYLLPIFNVLTLMLGWLLLRDHLRRQAQHQGLFATICRLFTFGKWQSEFLLRPIAIMACLFSFSVALYTGMELMVIEARVLWNTIGLPLILAGSAAFAVSGILIFLNIVIKGYEQQTTNTLLHWCRNSLAVCIGLSIIWAFAGSESFAQAQQLVGFNPAWQLSAVWILLCTILLIGLLVVAKKLNKFGLIILGLIAGHLAWGIRWIILIESQTVPKSGAGSYFYQISWGPDGVLGILGTFGLWFAIIVALSEILRQQSINKEA